MGTLETELEQIDLEHEKLSQQITRKRAQLENLLKNLTVEM